MKKILLMMLFLAVMAACVEDTAPEDEFGKGDNLVTFANASVNFASVSDGNEYPKTVNMKITGPRMSALDGAITATISVDPTSTAVEGVHYRMESNTITFSKDNDYLNVFPVVMLTEGIQAPLAKNPVLILNVASASGDDDVIASGKKITINLNYLCFEDLRGTYSVTISHSRCTGATYGGNFPFDVEITANPDGSWHLTSADGGFLGRCTGNAGLDNAGDIVIVCGEVQPSDNLDYGSLGIGNITGGTWDVETGTLTLEHAQTFTGNWPSSYTSTYVRK